MQLFQIYVGTKMYKRNCRDQEGRHPVRRLLVDPQQDGLNSGSGGEAEGDQELTMGLPAPSQLRPPCLHDSNMGQWGARTLHQVAGDPLHPAAKGRGALKGEEMFPKLADVINKPHKS